MVEFPKAIFRQDVPPPGGFPPIKTARHLPSRGPGAKILFGVSAVVIGFGFWKVGQGNILLRGRKLEKRRAQINILPYLQAEEDRKFVRIYEDYLKREAEIMKDVPGWKVGESTYKTGWMPPLRYQHKHFPF